MLYVMWTAHVLPGKMEEYHELMTKLLPLTEKHGAKVIGVWQMVVGNWEDVYTLQSYKDMANYEEVRAKMAGDPPCQELLVKLASIRTITCEFLRPTGYSPMS